MAFDPDAYLASAPAAGGGAFDPDAYLASGATPAAPAGRLEALGRGALQGATLGFSDEITGALESLLTSKSYDQARDEARAANAAAQGEHPWLYGGGELAGGLASSVVPGLGAAKAGTSLARAALRYGAQGALAGLGGSAADLTKGDVGGAAKDVAMGAGTGALIGGVLHGVGEKVNPVEKFKQDLNADVFGAARPKDRKIAFGVQGASPETFNEVAFGKDFEDVQRLARSGDVEGAHEAAQRFVDKASANRLENYRVASGAAAEEGIQPTVRVGDVVDRFEKEAAHAGATEGRNGEGRVLKSMAEDIRAKWETVPRESIAEGKLAPARRDALEAIKAHLPDRAEVTRRDVQDAAMKAAGVKAYGEIPEQMHAAVQDLTFTYQPEAKVDLLRMRQTATAAQQQARETLGSIAETEHYRISTAAEKVTNQALEKALDDVAAKSPAARAAVDRIRHDDKVISMGLSARDALEMRLTKESIGKTKTIGQRFGDAVGGLAKMEGIGHLAHGDVLTGTALMAAPYALKAASAGVRRGNDVLARLVYAARQGNPWAQRQVAILARAPGGAARVAALQAHAPGQASQAGTPAPRQLAPAPAAPIELPAPQLTGVLAEGDEE